MDSDFGREVIFYRFIGYHGSFSFALLTLAPDPVPFVHPIHIPIHFIGLLREFSFNCKNRNIQKNVGFSNITPILVLKQGDA